MKYLLIVFGVFVCIVSSLLIIVPYVRRKSDLLNFWTLFHVSCINYLGIASIDTGNAWTHLYTVPRDDDYIKYVIGGLAFYFSAIFCYYVLPFTDRLSQRVMTKVGPRSPQVMIKLLPICGVLTLGYLFVPNIQLLGQWMVIFGRAAAVFAVVFAYFAWIQRPMNTMLMLLVGFCLLVATVASNTEFGRRDFLGVLLTLPICWYWLRGRYYKPARVFTITAVAAVIAGAALAGVSITRSMRKNPDLSVLEATWEKVKAIPDAFEIQGSTEALWGSDCAEASLAAIRLYDRIQPTEPFFVEKYVLVHPIPRYFWPDKPEGLGKTLPIDIGWVSMHGNVNIGPGVIGHGYHEGGVFYLVVYGIWMALGMRFYDRLVRRDPTNPYVLGMLAGASGQIIAWCRGDIGLFTAIILGNFVSGLFLNYIARILFGTDRTAPVSQEAVEYEYPAGATWQHQ